jgi:hypothetical protein
MNVEELANRAAITDLIYRYCRAVDRIDEPLGHSVWHADGTADYGENFYVGPGSGVIDLICRQHRGTLCHSHQITNVLITLEGDKAGSESYCFATLQVQRGEALMQMSVWTRYIDRWSRRDGRWGIDHRVAIRDFDEVREVTPMSQGRMGSRNRNDPSYAVLGAIA